MTFTKNYQFCDHPLSTKMNNRSIVKKQFNPQTRDKFQDPPPPSVWTSKCLVPYRKQLFPSFNKKEKLLYSALYLPKCFCLEYAQYIKTHERSVAKVLITLFIKIILCSTLVGYVVIEINMIGY